MNCCSFDARQISGGQGTGRRTLRPFKPTYFNVPLDFFIDSVLASLCRQMLAAALASHLENGDDELGYPQSICTCEAVLQRRPQVGCIHYNVPALPRGRKCFLFTESRLRLLVGKVPGENIWMERRAQAG